MTQKLSLHNFKVAVSHNYLTYSPRKIHLVGRIWVLRTRLRLFLKWLKTWLMQATMRQPHSLSWIVHSLLAGRDVFRTMRNVCLFYRRVICRYGVAARLCPKDRPPACKRLIKHGNRSTNGCTLGRACESFHQKMCPGSPTNKSKKRVTDPVSLLDHF